MSIPKTSSIKKPLRIAYVIDDGMNSEDGVQAYARTLGDWMRSHGHTVHYLCGETSRTDIPGLFPLARNLKVKFNGNYLSIPWPTSSAKIKRHLAEYQYDVVHVQIPHSPFFGAKVAKLASPSSAIFSTFHILPYGFLARYGSKLLGLWLKGNLKHFDQHFANSPASMKFSKWSFGIPRSMLLPNMVNGSAYAPDRDIHTVPPKDSFEIVFVGRLVERKGCRYLVEAVARLLVNDPRARFTLHICGKGPLKDELEEMVSAKNLDDRVVFHGFVSTEEKIRRLQSADIAVFPSYSGESFGIVLIEAMAAGAGVVVGGENPGYSYVLESTPETIAKVKDIDSFAQLLQKCMSDRSFFIKTHKLQQQAVRQFDVSVVGPKMLSQYESCIHQKNQK